MLVGGFTSSVEIETTITIPYHFIEIQYTPLNWTKDNRIINLSTYVLQSDLTGLIIPKKYI